MKGTIKKEGNTWSVRYYTPDKIIHKRFKNFSDAEDFRAGLRVKEKEGILDSRDYSRENPLGFENKVQEFLYSKRLLKGVKKYEQRLKFGLQKWGNRNIKNIGFTEINELITGLRENEYSSKYIKDIRDCIKTFYRWLWQTGEITYDQIPRFPKIKVSMLYRKILSKQDQMRVLSELREITRFNPRIYIGVLFLTTYINLRPGELIGIREKDIDLENRLIKIRHSKTGDQKHVFILPSDIQYLEPLMSKFPHNYFFRHICGRGGNKAGTKFGKGYLYKWWKKACANLGITGVDLYGGTRHSSAIALGETRTPEEVKIATEHKTGQAFERYFRLKENQKRQLYADTRGEIVRIKNGFQSRS